MGKWYVMGWVWLVGVVVSKAGGERTGQICLSWWGWQPIFLRPWVGAFPEGEFLGWGEFGKQGVQKMQDGVLKGAD